MDGRTEREEGKGGWKRIQLNSRIFTGINYFRGRKDPGRYHAAATTILTAPPPPFHLLLSLVFFQPDFSVSLRTGMQFTELFLNPSGGTTAEQEESGPEEKRNKKKKGKADWKKRRRRRLRRRWWNEVGGSHGVSCFVREARPPLSLCFFARKPRSDIAPDTPPAPVLRYLYTCTRYMYLEQEETRLHCMCVCVCIFLFRRTDFSREISVKNTVTG